MISLSAFLSFFNSATIVWLAITLAIITHFCQKIKEKQSFWKKKGVKYIKPKFLIGNMEIIRSKSFAEMQLDLYGAFSEERYCGFYQFLEPILVLRDPDLIKQITVKEFDHFVDHQSFINSDTDPFWSKNLFFSQGERWRDLRSTLSPSFTGSKMRMMYILMDECAREYVKFFKKDASDIVELEVKDAFSRYTNDVIATTAFGLKCNSLEDRNNEFYLMGKEAADFGGVRSLKMILYFFSPKLFELLKMKITPGRVGKYFCKIIEDTVRTRREGNIVRPDMIHLLMEAQKERQQLNENSKNDKKQEITLLDIAAQAFLFFLAGFETASTLVTFLFYEIALHPDIQRRLREEVASISGKITYETLSAMKYLDMVVSETLRKWPPAILTNRKVTKAFTIQPEMPGEKPLRLEEGTICWLLIYGLHHDPKLFPDPEKFDPERFNDYNKHKIHPSAYIPFGAGPRNCIGSRFALLESKLIVFHILRNFEVVPVGKTRIPVVLDKSQMNLTAKGGIWLGLKKITA